jgi:DNA-binding IclR family transcriptional regulator
MICGDSRLRFWEKDLMSQSVRRAARIIDSIAVGPKTVAELADEFGIHRSTMFRELQTLEEVGYARRRKGGSYSLGTRLMSLSQIALDNLDLRGAAHEHIRRLHKSVGHTIHLAALMENSIVYVDKVDSGKGIQMYSGIGKAVLPYCSGVGKVILANLSVPERDRILDGIFWERFTDATLTSRAELDKELEVIKAERWASDRGEFDELVKCVAIPIISGLRVVGALSVTSISASGDLEDLMAHIPMIQETAGLISRELN